MRVAIVRYGWLLALFCGPAVGDAFAADLAVIHSGVGRIDEGLWTISEGFTRSPILAPEYARHCRPEMRWQPFPIAHGYGFGCVPWR